MAFILSGYVFDDVGNGINGATVKLLPNGSNTPDQTTSTAADGSGQNGYWTFTTASDKQYNVEVDYQGHVRKYYSATGVQFNNLTIGINALQVDLSGNLTMSNPLAPADGSFRLSPLLKLQGSYDSNAAGGSVTQTNEWMALQTTVAATTGAYKLSFINMTSAEIASLTSAGLFNVASGGDIQINASPVITTIASAGATITPVKTANSYDLAVVANTTNQKVNVLNNGASVGTRKAVNFIPGTNISYTIADNAGSDRVDVTVTASGTITGTAGGVTNATDAIIRADDDVNASGTVILRTGNTDQLVVANGGDTTLLQNLIWKSGTAFKGTLDHANSADRIYTFQDLSDTIVGRTTTDTLTNKTITAPSIGGTVSGGATYSGITLSGTTTWTGNESQAGDHTIDLNGALTRTLTIQNSTASQITNIDLDGSLFFRNGTAFTMNLLGTPTANRVFTFPDVASDTVVLLAATQTLTGKTLTSPSIGGTVAGGASYTAPTITSPSITGTVGGSATYTTPSLTTPSVTSGGSWTGAINTVTAPASWTPALIIDNAATSTNLITEYRVAGTRRGSTRIVSSGAFCISGQGTEAVYVSWDEGTGGTNFGNGLHQIVASISATGTLTANTGFSRANQGTPTLAAGANNGTSPPTPTAFNGTVTDVSGCVQFGSGTTPAGGIQVQVTFSAAQTTTNAPVIVGSWGNQVTVSALGPIGFVPQGSSGNWTGFIIRSLNAPAGSQGGTTYTVNYFVHGG